MTLLDTTPVAVPSAPGGTARSFVRRNRAIVILAVLAVAALLALALTAGVGTSGEYEPGSYQPQGGHALATLLREQGVTVTRTSDIPSTDLGAGADTTIFVPQPEELTPEELTDLKDSGARLVVVNADPRAVAGLTSDALLDGFDSTHDRDPGCGLDAAVRASTSRMGGYTYESNDPQAQSCYGGSLLSLPDLTLIGDGTFTTNQHLGSQGNAELALRLLGQTREVRWLIPSPTRAVIGGAPPPTSLNDIIPSWVKLGVVQLMVALVVLCLWRARRLGRVVSEPLPIVVRAAETVEGRGRLYRAAGSRDTAAEALRSGARDRIGRRLGAGRRPTPDTLLDLVTRRVGRPDARDLLYGPPPVDDAGLVRLATALDALTQEVADS